MFEHATVSNWSKESMNSARKNPRIIHLHFDVKSAVEDMSASCITIEAESVEVFSVEN